MPNLLQITFCSVSCPILSIYPVLSCPYLSYPILSCPILPYPVLSCPILSYPVLSYPILSYPVLSCPILSYSNICPYIWVSGANRKVPNPDPQIAKPKNKNNERPRKDRGGRGGERSGGFIWLHIKISNIKIINMWSYGWRHV